MMAFPISEGRSGGDMSMSMDDVVEGGGSHASSKPAPPPAPFLTKTYQLVDDPSTDHAVSWGEDGATFVVWRPPEFARDILPNYFKHNNFSSFVRQLNTYGFRKIVADRWEFANEFFRKGAAHLLSEIHRRKSSSCVPPPKTPHQLPYLGGLLFSAAPPPPPQRHVPPAAAYRVREDQDFIATLWEDNRQLRQRNALLLAELARMRRLYNDIVYFLQNHVEPVLPPSSAAGCRLVELGSDTTSVTLLSRRPPREEDDDEAARPVKLFGVRLDEGRKRRAHAVHLEEEEEEEGEGGGDMDDGDGDLKGVQASEKCSTS